MKIVWKERTVAVDDLKPYERNPRRISKHAFDKLKQSLQDDGYHQRIIATKDLRVIGGHQRIQALKELGIKSIEVLTPDKKISDKEFKRILVRDNLPFGDFDFDILSADYEPEELIELGMPEDWLPNITDDETEENEKDGEEPLDSQIICCPKCNHEFSILTSKEND